MTTENEGQGNQPNGQQNQGDAGQNGNQGNQGDQNKGTETAQNDATLLDLEGKDTGVKFTTGKKPEGLDDTLWDSKANRLNDQAALDKITSLDKQAKDLREKLGRKGAPPEKAEDYKFEAPADAPWKDMVPADDPVLKAAKEQAHKMGLSQGQFAPLVVEVLNAAFKAQQGDTQTNDANLTDEQKAAKEAAVVKAREDEVARIGPNGPAVIRAVSEFVRQNAGVHFDQDAMEFVKVATSSAEGVKFLNVIREMVGGEKLPMGSLDGAAITGLPSDAEIQAVIASPEYQKGDPSTLSKVEGWLSQRQKAGRGVYLGT